MKRENGGFASGVVCEVGDADVACCAGDGDDVAFVGGEHGREKRLDGVPVAEYVDVEELLQVVVWRVENAVWGQDACVVDEDAGVA